MAQSPIDLETGSTIHICGANKAFQRRDPDSIAENLGKTSCSRLTHTRYGEYIMQSQCESVELIRI